MLFSSIIVRVALLLSYKRSYILKKSPFSLDPIHAENGLFLS
ncbi:hypothetical protein HMPREF9412_6623 [Paenibacillus sp. HGF5]|nr:hypothetical protein HMPREF9412_6623 [Paenibacillus sp. HGF5]